MDQGRRDFTIGVLTLIFLALLVFGQSVLFDFVPYDDPAYVTQNDYVSTGVSEEGLRWAFLGQESASRQVIHDGVGNLWHPLTWVSHMVDCDLFGASDAAGHHGVNVFLHLLASIFVMGVFTQLFGNCWSGLLLAALWMVHPLKAESVAWVSERKDVLSGMFFWGAFWCGLGQARARRVMGWVLFVCALLSKPSVVVLPVLLALIEAHKRGETDWGVGFLRSALRNWWAWFAAAVAIGVLTLMVQGSGSHQDFAENSSLWSRAVPMAWGFWFYVWRMLVPWDLSIDYPMPKVGLMGYASAWALFVVFVGLLWKKRSEWRAAWVGFVWFVVCWLPISGLVYIGGSFTSDRYLYLALVGPLFLLVHWVGTQPRRRFAGGGLVLLWAALAFLQTSVWRNGFTLFSHATKAQPKAALGWSNLGALHKENERWDEAEGCFKKSVELHPLNYIAWHNLANVHLAGEEKEAAKEALVRSLEAYPKYLPALSQLGVLLRDDGQLAEARDLFRRGSERSQFLLWCWCETELQLGDFKEARRILALLEGQAVIAPPLQEEIVRARKFLRGKALVD